MRTSTSRFSQYVYVFLAYVVIVFLLKFFRWGSGVLFDLSLLFSVLGLFLGLWVSLFDRLIFAYFTKPQDPFSHQVKNLISQKRFREVIRVLYLDTYNDRHLATNNVLFLAVWVVLAFFVLTSSYSRFGQGLILGIGLSLVIDLFNDMERTRQLKDRLFWPIAREMNDTELKIVTFTFMAFFVFMSWLAI